jgi:hypothetical protein
MRNLWGGIVQSKSRLALVFILLATLGLRLTAIFWGVPTDANARRYHPDETKIVRGAYEFPEHIWSNKDLRYPTALHYTVGLLALPLRLLPEEQRYRAVYLTARGFSLLLGILSIWLIYLLGAKLRDDRVALLSAFLLAFSVAHVTNSVWATTDVATSFLLTAFLLTLWQFTRTPRASTALIAGCVLGLLVGTKYTGILALIPLTLTLFLIPAENFSGQKKFSKLLQYGLLMLGAGALIFALTTPGALVYPKIFIESLLQEKERIARILQARAQTPFLASQFGALVQSQGPVLAVVSILGAFWYAASRKTWALPLLGLLIAFILSTGNSIELRYVIFIQPVLALFAADFLMDLARQPRRVFQWIGLGLIVVTGVQAVLYSFLGVAVRYSDSRDLAGAYVEKNIPAGSSIGMAYAAREFGWAWHAWKFPPVDFETRFQEKDMLAYPDYLIVSSNESDLIRAILLQKPLTADFHFSEEEKAQFYGGVPPSLEVLRFYADVWEGRAYCPIRTFEARVYIPVEFPPPTIQIYRLNPQRAPCAP